MKAAIAATAYNAGLERLMRLQAGAEEKLLEAVALDPGFAVGHAALAMLGYEAGAAIDVTTSLQAARDAARTRADERERSLVEVVGRRVEDVRRSGATALMNHIAQHPRDVLAVSAADATAEAAPPIRIGSKSFTESYLVAEIVAHVAADKIEHVSSLAERPA